MATAKQTREIQDIARIAGAEYPDTPAFRKYAEQLFVACGGSEYVASTLTTRELTALVQVAKQDPQAATLLAARIGKMKEAATALPDILGDVDPLGPLPPARPSPVKASPVKADPVQPAPAMSETIVKVLVEKHTRPLAENVNDLNGIVKAALRAMGDDVETMRESVARTAETAATTAREALKGDIVDLVRKAFSEYRPTVLTIEQPGQPDPIKLGVVHKQTPRIIKALAAGLNVYLHGPAGSGKTTVGRNAADAFGLKFYTAAKVESEYLLLGFKDARGETVRTQFREAYEHGGVFLFDELDASSPGAVVALNMALANGVCPFPDGNVTRHKDFHCIAAGNTVMSGSSRQYTGRSQMDAASIDRFYFIEFGYDNELERTLASDAKWVENVQAYRAIVAERGLPHLITPRATIDGCKALAAGEAWEDVEDACIFKGLDRDTVEQLRTARRKAGPAAPRAFAK